MESQQNLKRMVRDLRGDPYLTAQEEALLTTVLKLIPVLSSLSSMLCLTDIVRHLEALVDLRRTSELSQSR